MVLQPSDPAQIHPKISMTMISSCRVIEVSRERVAKIFPEPTEDLKVTEKHEVTGVTGAEYRPLMVTWESRSGSFTRDQV